MAQSPDAQGGPPVLSPGASIPAGPAITVVGTEYHFAGLPTTVPVGTVLTLDNQGDEVHELIVVRRNDGVTKTWDELLAMPNDEAFQYITAASAESLIAAPGETAEGSIVIPETGDYLAVCFIPQGTTTMSPPASPAAGQSAAPEGMPHFMLGMRQEFTVTDAGTEVGPLPSASPMESMAPMASSAP